jgi:hypothetical protein
MSVFPAVALSSVNKLYHSKLVPLLGPTLHMMSKLQINYNNVPDTLQLKEKEVQNQFLKPYTMFRYSVRSEVTQKYYERRLRKFFDYIE